MEALAFLRRRFFQRGLCCATIRRRMFECGGEAPLPADQSTAARLWDPIFARRQGRRGRYAACIYWRHPRS